MEAHTFTKRGAVEIARKLGIDDVAVLRYVNMHATVPFFKGYVASADTYGNMLGIRDDESTAAAICGELARMGFQTEWQSGTLANAYKRLNRLAENGLVVRLDARQDDAKGTEGMGTSDGMFGMTLKGRAVLGAWIAIEEADKPALLEAYRHLPSDPGVSKTLRKMTQDLLRELDKDAEAQQRD